MLGTFMADVPVAVEAAPSSSPATPMVEAVPSVIAGPFTVVWTQTNPAGRAIPMRLGRDRSKPALWGDGYDNFGLVHIHKGHVGHGKDWSSDLVMVAQVRRALEKPNGIFPDQYTPYFSHYVLCDEGAIQLSTGAPTGCVWDPIGQSSDPRHRQRSACRGLAPSRRPARAAGRTAGLAGSSCAG